MILNFESSTTLTGLNTKQSTADPVAIDMGNINTQGRVVSKTVQMGLFTNNRNAIWAGTNLLRRLSYPFATIEVPVNRDLFDHEVGDCIKFSHARYGISNKVYRIVQKQEEGPESERILVTLMEDLFGIVNIDDGALPPTILTVDATDYTATALLYSDVFELPYFFGTEISVLPLAAKRTELEVGFQVHRSLDDGNSYSIFDTSEKNYVVYGTLNADYDIGKPAIDDEGFAVTITIDDDLLSTSTMSEILTGTTNLAIIEDEIISFQTITPLTATTFQLSNILRGRYGTRKATHAEDTPIWMIPSSDLDIYTSDNFTYDADFYFKLVPYNTKLTGVVADATAIDLTITNKVGTPYSPVNFCANDRNYAARYDDDIVLTWSARKRGEGAGIGTPGTVLPTSGHEGYFEVKVYISGSLVRTQSAIDALTWTYTEAMNISDNGSLASTVIFTITNYLTTDSIRLDSSSETVTCKKNL